jgi:hypothetical protein
LLKEIGGGYYEFKKLGLLGLFCMCILYLNTTCDAKTEEEYSEIIGNSKFTYQDLTRSAHFFGREISKRNIMWS